VNYFKNPVSCQPLALSTQLLYLILAIIILTLAITTCTAQARARRGQKNTDLKIGSQAPDFTFIDETGAPTTLNSFLKTHHKIALCFYPKDGSPFCTQQLCSLRDDYAELKKQGITIIGLSADSGKSHKKFKEKYQLSYPLVADKAKKIAKLYNAHRGWFGMTTRKTVLIKDGLIAGIIDKVDVADHAKQIIDGFGSKS
jgi:peroxiredoxin Q/BCP